MQPSRPTLQCDEPVDPVVELTGDSLTIRGRDDTGVDVEATLSTSSSAVQKRGEVDGLQLLRVSVVFDHMLMESIFL